MWQGASATSEELRLFWCGELLAAVSHLLFPLCDQLVADCVYPFFPFFSIFPLFVRDPAGRRGHLWEVSCLSFFSAHAPSCVLVRLLNRLCPEQNMALPANVAYWWRHRSEWKPRRDWMTAFGFGDACGKSNICPRCFPLCLISSMLSHPCSVPHSTQDGGTAVSSQVLL